ncbi:MAG: response regulator [Planctomycetota bacterium]
MNDSLPALPPILLVDDEPEILHSLKSLLRREFTLHTAESGAEALKILAEHTIQVIMTDQRMPEMNGSQLLHEVNQVSPETIRIIFTGYADIKAVVDAINCGELYRYITKPWDPDELIDVLTAATKEFQRRKHQQLVLQEASEFCRHALGAGLKSDLCGEAKRLVDRIKAMNL